MLFSKWQMNIDVIDFSWNKQEKVQNNCYKFLNPLSRNICERQTERERHTQRDRPSDLVSEQASERQTERETDRQRERETDRQRDTDRQTDSERERERGDREDMRKRGTESCIILCLYQSKQVVFCHIGCAGLQTSMITNRLRQHLF